MVGSCDITPTVDFHHLDICHARHTKKGLRYAIYLNPFLINICRISLMPQVLVLGEQDPEKVDCPGLAQRNQVVVNDDHAVMILFQPPFIVSAHL